MTRFQEHDSTRFTFEGKEYAADLESRGNRMSFVSPLPDGIEFDPDVYSSFRVYDEDDVEYFGLWVAEDLSPRKEEEFPEPVMVVRVWDGMNKSRGSQI